MNWFTPLTPSRENYRVTIASDWAPIWNYEALFAADPLAPYGDLVPLFRQSDFNIVNIECVLGEAGSPIPKAGPCLRGNREHGIASLIAAPFHLGTLANNHSMDYGPESLAITLDALREAGIGTVGAGMDVAEAAVPFQLSAQGKRPKLAIINCGEGEACASLDGSAGANVYDPKVQSAQIHALRAQGYAVVVIFHGGREHAASPPPYVVDGLRELAEAGATAIVAHHPHVPQGVEIHYGCPIAYSQGNFVFYHGADTFYQNTGYLVHLDFHPDGMLDAIAITPYRMKPDGVFALEPKEAAAFRDELRMISTHLASRESIEALWNAFADEYGQGQQTVLDQLIRGLEEYKSAPDAAIARWHHYFFAPAHRHYFSDAFKRMKLGTFDDSPQWARLLVNRWKTRKLCEEISPKEAAR